MNSISASTQHSFQPQLTRVPLFMRLFIGLAIFLVAALFVWQAIVAAGAPDPTLPGTSHLAAVLDIATLVFREGLECVLVLAALMASMIGNRAAQRKPVAVGVLIGIVGTLATWFIAVRIVSDISLNVSVLNLQVWTGLLAIIVLLIVMNWFFHKFYWGGWIALHHKKKNHLVNGLISGMVSRRQLLFGLGLLGFSSLYREGFEIVIFLQSYFLKFGGKTVLLGTLFGLFFSSLVAWLTFIAHHRLPYRKMLELTGVMLGFVLLVMVGEQAQEMQLANWIPTTTISCLNSCMPRWLGVWFSLFPTVETIVAQALAAIIVIGSFFLAKGHKNSPQSN